jgi:hypothetical protein
MERPQSDWDWLAFLSNWHEKEYERRYTLENLVVTPITLLTGAYGLSYLLVTQYDFKHGGWLCASLFVLAIVVAVGFACYSSFYVYKSYAVVKGKVYKNLPNPTLLRTHMADLVDHYNQHDPEEDGARKFQEYFVELLATQITANVINNDDRTENIQDSKKPVMGALLALLLAMPCFLTNQLTKPDSTYQVSVLPHTAEAMSKPTSPLPPKEPQTPSPPPTTKPQPPSPPPQREIYEKIPLPPFRKKPQGH